MPVLNIEDIPNDEDYILARAKDAQTKNIYSAKAWMITAKTLYPTNFKIQFEAYLMEKQSGNVSEAAECLSSMIMTKQNMSDLLPEISAIANSLKSNDGSFMNQMFDKMSPDVQLIILKTSIEHSDDTMEHCRLLVLLLKKFPQLGVDSLVKTLINAEKFFYDNHYARLLVVETLPLLSSLESPRLLQRLMVKAMDFYNTYVYNDTEHDISDPWQRLYSVLDLLGKQLGWDPYFINYSNTLNTEVYLQKLSTLRSCEDCRQLLYCGTIFLLRCLNEQRTLKTNHVLLECFTNPEKCDMPQINPRSEIEITGVGAVEFQAAAHCWDLLHSNEVISREFMKLSNQLQIKPWTEEFSHDLGMYKASYDEILQSTDSSLITSLIKASIYFVKKIYPSCVENVLLAISQLPAMDGALEPELIVVGALRHLHFLPLTKFSVMHFISTLLIRILQSTGSSTDINLGHFLVLMQLSWPQEEVMFQHIIETIKKKGTFQYPQFSTYIIHIDILEEFSFMWNELGNNIVLDLTPNSQQHLGQRRIGTRGADKGVKEDFKQAMKAQVSRSNESLLNLLTQFINQERAYFLQIS